MVNIKIEHCDSLHLAVIKGSDGGYGDAVKETEPHGTVVFRVVARWPNRAENSPLETVQNRVHASEDCACGEPGSTDAGSTHPRIRIKGQQAFFGLGGQQEIYVGLTVCCKNPFIRDRPGLDHLKILSNAKALPMIHQVNQPLGSFGVSVHDQMIEVFRMGINPHDVPELQGRNVGYRSPAAAPTDQWECYSGFLRWTGADQCGRPRRAG